jgi:hypothetical protein
VVHERGHGGGRLPGGGDQHKRYVMTYITHRAHIYTKPTLHGRGKESGNVSLCQLQGMAPSPDDLSPKVSRRLYAT